MNIFSKELAFNRRSLLFWSIGSFFMVISGMAKYAGAAGSNASLDDMMNSLPPAIRSIVGAGVFDLSEPSGYYGMLFLYLILMAAIHAGMLGADIIAKEERDRTTEFLFVKPTSRTRAITQKLAAALVNVVLFNLVTLVSSVMIVAYYAKDQSVTPDIVKLMAGMFIVQLVFLFIGTSIAAYSQKPKSAGSVTTAILLATFIFSVAIDINDRLVHLAFLTPFQYFSAKRLMYGGHFDGGFLLLSAILIGAGITLTYTSFKRRDLSV